LGDLIESLRPFLRGIDELAWFVVNKSLNPGESIEFRPGKAGWLVDIAVVVDTPYLSVKHNYWGQDIEYSIYSVYVYGNLSTNVAYNYVTKYDTVNNIYSMAYAPRPFKYYTKSAYIKITAPLINPITLVPITTPATITYLLVHYLEITDLDELKKSMQEVLGSGIS